MIRWRFFWVGILVGVSTIDAALEISPEQAQRPPTAEWLTTTLTGGRVSWSQMEIAAGDAAMKAEATNRTAAMEGWLLVARWARIFGTDQRVATQRWINATNAAKLGHANMAATYERPAEPLSAVVTPDFAVRLIRDPDLSRTFFELISPYDDWVQVLRILNALHAADDVMFTEYTQLALAIALVFDVPPPPSWPHAQVSAKALPRKLAPPMSAFRFWVDSDRRHRTLHRLSRLDASELKYVVNAAAPEPELLWVQMRTDVNFASLPRTYDAVAYRTDRADRGVMVWPRAIYTLPAILAEGGICIDQAYFASEVGKARGVPTLLFGGVGQDGRHAWFGYLDEHNKWQLDVGRYAEQKLVSGVALDPQTWADVNDHELAFLAEGFRLLPSYKQSQARQYMAQEYLRRGNAVAAVAAAQKAVNQEPRNVEAWQVLQGAQRAAGLSAVKREATLRQAMRAMQRYPDLQAMFWRDVIAVLRERGQTSAAEHEEQQLVRLFTQDRSDLAVEQAAAMLNRSLADDDAVTQLRVFESALRQSGVSAGLAAFDRLVRPFFDQVLAEGRKTDAAQVLVITQRMLPIDPQSQFARDLLKLADRLRRS